MGGADNISRLKNTAAALLITLCAIVCTGCGDDAPSAPEAAMTAAPAAAAESEYAGKLRISELMSKNQAAVMDETGAFPDWIEIENVSDEDMVLTGFTISDGEDKPGWTFPEVMLAAGGQLLIYADGTDSRNMPLHTDFSLSKDETVFLRDAGGALIDTAQCTTDKADQALARGAQGEWKTTFFCTPGYPNTNEGYNAWQDSLTVSSPLIISEAVTSNTSTLEQKELGYCDWVEIKNVSSATVELRKYYLSDDKDELRLWGMPNMTLAPGESVIVICDETGAPADAGYLRAPFALSRDGEQLFLTDSSGKIADYASLHDIPQDGSMGRMSGRNGWFYFAVPQPGKEKTGGGRRVSEMPVCPGGDGIYDGVKSVTVEIEAAEGADIYYTLDGTDPVKNGIKYDGALTLTKTAVVKAAAVESDALPSAALTLSYIINEGHTLPVASLVADDPVSFRSIYGSGRKNEETGGSLTFFAPDGGFTIPCGIDMHGETSLALPKKNMGLHFRSRYGQSELNYDLFGGGVTGFKALVLRAGQDQTNTIVRNELLENLCLQYSGSVPTQRSRYCVLYINGEYAGIYALMEKMNEQHYARLMGVDRAGVTVMKAWADPGSEYYEQVIRFAMNNDLTQAESYGRFCELVDIDCLIDWMIIEGYSANTDLSTSNLRYAHSNEGDGRWRFMLYDMDATLTSPACIFSNVLKPSSTQSAVFITQLLKNTEFRTRFLTRAGEVMKTTLSNENVDAEIVRLTEQIAPEAERDLKINNMTLTQWQNNVKQLRAAITEGDWNGRCIEAIRQYMSLTPEELRQYFG